MMGIFIYLKTIVKKVIWIFSNREHRRDQLEVFLPQNIINSRIDYEVPEGYVLRLYCSSDALNYINLMQQAGFTEWSQKITEDTLKYCVPRGFFVVEHMISRRLVGTFMARHISDIFHPYGGRLDWLAVDPKHNGKKLGYILVAASANRLIDMGYENIYITTDDHRVAAICNFLKAGFVPDLYSNEMYMRWQKICNKINYAFEPASWEELGNNKMLSLDGKK